MATTKALITTGLVALVLTGVAGTGLTNKTPAWANNYVLETATYVDPVALAWVQQDLATVSNNLETKKPASQDEYIAWLKRLATDTSVLARTKRGHSPRGSRCSGVRRGEGGWVKFRCQIALNGLLTFTNTNYDFSSLGPDNGLATFGAAGKPWATRPLVFDLTGGKWAMSCPWKMHAPPTPCRPVKP